MKTFNEIIEVVSKENLLDRISTIMEEKYGTNKEIVLNDLLKREENYSTGLENGFAIPHCRTKAVSEPHVLFLKLQNEITDYETIDGNGVSYVISFIVPDNKDGEEAHLRLLSQVMRKLVNKDVQNSIKESTDLEEIQKILEI